MSGETRFFFLGRNGAEAVHANEMAQSVAGMLAPGFSSVALGIPERAQLFRVVAKNQIRQSSTVGKHCDLDLVVGKQQRGNFLEAGIFHKAGIGRLGERGAGKVESSRGQNAHAPILPTTNEGSAICNPQPVMLLPTTLRASAAEGALLAGR